MLKVVIDANVFVSATITEKGKPAQILKVWREKKLEVIILIYFPLKPPQPAPTFNFSEVRKED